MTVLHWRPKKARIGWLSDVHLGIEDTSALSIAVDVMEAAGVDHVVAGGDIADCHAISEHAKDIERILEAGTLLEEVEAGRWLFDWFTTRGDRAVMICGNHESRLDRLVAKYAPGLHGSVGISEALKLPASLKVLPPGGQVRIGSLVLEHGDAVFPRGAAPGGKYPSHRLLDLFPDQNTIIGHVHRQTSAVRTYVNESGVARSRGAWTMGHLSQRDKHAYAGRNPNWQQGFGIIDVFTVGGRPRFSVMQVEIHRDRRDRPYAQWARKVYR